MRTIRFDIERLNEALLQAELSPAELAEKAGICTRSVYFALKGRMVQMRTARAISAVLKCKVLDVIQNHPATHGEAVAV